MSQIGKRNTFCCKKTQELLGMKKSTEIIVAGFLGTAAVFGLIALGNFLKNKEYQQDYSDHHKLFGTKADQNPVENNDSIEINAYL